MSVNSYLTSLASSLVLNSGEDATINKSIATLKGRLENYFKSDIKGQFKFGSSTRGTILPRKADEESDIDYMIVFNTAQNTYKPQTYLNRLKNFVEFYYSSSEIHQSHPVILLELNHIKFDLVPAITNIFSQYLIPKKGYYFDDWIVTSPNDFNQNLTNANIQHNYQIKPLVRLIKYWNSQNGHDFSSYDLENHIVNQLPYGINSLNELFYYFWNYFSCSVGTPQYIKDKVVRAKDKVKSIQNYEKQGYYVTAENELEKFLPKL